MPDAPIQPPLSISEEQAAARYNQNLDLVELMTQIWLENPALLRQAGRKAQAFMLPLEQVQLRHANDLL